MLKEEILHSNLASLGIGYAMMVSMELTASVSVFQTWAESQTWNNFSLPTRNLGCRRGVLSPSGCGCHSGGYGLSS